MLLRHPPFRDLLSTPIVNAVLMAYNKICFLYQRVLFYAESKAEVEHLVLRAVPVDVWKNLRSQAVIIKDWYETQYPKSATGITSNGT